MGSKATLPFCSLSHLHLSQAPGLTHSYVTWLSCQHCPERGGLGNVRVPPLLLCWESNLGLMEMYAPRGHPLVSQHGTFTQGGPG